MAASVTESPSADPGTSDNKTTVATSSDVPAGSTIEVYLFVNFVGVTGVERVGLPGETYNLVDTLGSGQNTLKYVAYNVAGGPCTVQANYDTSTGVRPMRIVVIPGVQTAPADGHRAQTQPSPGTGLLGVSSDVFTNAAQPDLLTGFACNLFNSEPLADASWTDHGSCWNVTAGGGRLQSKRVTATSSSNEAKFTAQIDGQHFAFGGAYKELAASAAGALAGSNRRALTRGAMA